MVEDSQIQDPEPVPNLLCNESMPISPNSSYSFVDNLDFAENDLRNDSFLKLLCPKKTEKIEPVHEIIAVIERASSPLSSDAESPTCSTPVVITERRISPRKSCKKPSAATDHCSDIEDVDCPKDFDSDDSVKDKNYCVTEADLATTDLDTSIEENEVTKQRKTNKSKIKLQNQNKCDKSTDDENIVPNSEDQTDQQTHTPENRVETVTVASGLDQANTEKVQEEIDKNYSKQ